MAELSILRLKQAETDHVVMEEIAKRWSPRAFADRPVDDATILRILEAARWAPSNFNEQPWRFIVARREDEERFKRLHGCLLDNNARWARHASVLMLSVCKERYAKTGEPIRTADHDVGLAVAQMVLQATHEGLYAHQMAGIDLQACRDAFAIPDDHHPIAAIAFGYLGDPDALPADLRERELKPRSRTPMTDFVFGERFGESAEWVARAP